ncbi:hypothetical protein BDW66DRAFT_44064 [Aspergillus desertorum]
MTTLIPRGPYTQDEIEKLYPKELKLQLVQVFLRHGERTPVSSRFENDCYHTGLTAMSPVAWSKWPRAMRTFHPGTPSSGGGSSKHLAIVIKQ